MTVTVEQCDRDAAASGYFAWVSGNPVMADKMRTGKADNHSMVQAFARHRLNASFDLDEALKAMRNLSVAAMLVNEWIGRINDRDGTSLGGPQWLELRKAIDSANGIIARFPAP